MPCFQCVQSSRVLGTCRKLAQCVQLIQKLHTLNQTEGRQGVSHITSEQIHVSQRFVSDRSWCQMLYGEKLQL